MDQPELVASAEQIENLQYGFIKVFRSIRKHWLWKDSERLKWWIDILLEVNHSPQKVIIKGTLFDCDRGQSLQSLQTWAKAWRVSIKRVRTFFELLEKDQMIVTKSVGKTTRLTVCNYDTYNNWGQSEGISEVTSQVISQGNVKATNNKDKNYKNGKNIEIRPKGLTASFDAARQEQTELKKKYRELVEQLAGKDNAECWTKIKEFIHEGRPRFIEPYIDAWNIFGMNYHLQKGPISVTEQRRKKFDTRIHEEGFDFLEVLAKVKGSHFLKGSNDRNWKVDFDFIVNSEQNYTKILEEKYDW
jgi:hypothetical protein